MVLDALTGEVLALANVPSYNPNNRAVLNPEMRRNRAVVDMFEPGSTMKPFPVAMALDAGKRVFCEKPTLTIAEGRALARAPKTRQQAGGLVRP